MERDSIFTYTQKAELYGIISGVSLGMMLADPERFAIYAGTAVAGAYGAVSFSKRSQSSEHKNQDSGIIYESSEALDTSVSKVNEDASVGST